MKKKILIALSLILMLTNKAYALKEDTHKVINQNIGIRTINGFSLDTYLINQLGFYKGKDEELNGLDADGRNANKKIFEWLGYGGEQEDRPGSYWDYIRNNPTRSVNHFHNPLKTNWDEAGLNDLGKTGQSSILWAQNINQDPNQNLGGKWSWQDVREYFYIALTGRDFTGNNVASLPGETEEKKRERYFANTFRGIGQLMHLVEDASVPEHVRNDAHILKAYEGYVLDFQTKTEYGALWNNFLANPITFDKSVLEIPTGNPSASEPISRIVDTDLYTGDNPDVTTTLYNSPQPIGVSEYANANFLSKDTMFTIIDPLHSFNYPNVADTVLWLDNNNREYVRKVGNGDTINHLARTSLFYSYRQIYFPQYTDYLPLGLDEECYKEYASNLIPRAVGYSAGLLNYFFRGNIDIVPDDTLGGYIIVNNSDEDMRGKFQLFYDNSRDERIPIQLQGYDDVTLEKASSGNNKSGNINISIPTDALRYVLVFRGKLGNENDAVAGRVYELNRNFLFLVDLYGQTTAFEIKPTSNQYQLLPVSDKTVNITVYNDSTSLTVQSHPNKTEHVAELPISRYNADGSYQTSYGPYLNKNGIRYGGRFDYDTLWLDMIKGFPQAYIPSNFSAGSSYAWDSGFTYGEWVSGQYYGLYDWRHANYIHGRRPFEVVNNRLVAKNINIRKNDNYTYSGSDYSGPFHVQYLDKTGNWVRGIDLPDGNDYLAVLDRNKTIYTKTDIPYDQSQWSPYEDIGSIVDILTQTFRYVNNWCDRTYTVRRTESCPVKETIFTSASSEQTQLVVGGTIIENFIYQSDSNWPNVGINSFECVVTTETISDSNPECWLYGGTSEWVSTSRNATIDGPDLVSGTLDDGSTYTSFSESGYSNSIGRNFNGVMDYDNVDGDKNIILFYGYDDVNLYSGSFKAEGGAIVTYPDGNVYKSGVSETLNSEVSYIYNTGYVMVYKIENLLNKIDLGISFTRSSYNQYGDGISTISNSMYGKRITGFSSQINDTNMVYTYIIERTNGNEDTWNPDWVFEKRIIGVINISDSTLPVGYKQEFEFNSSGSGFDFSELAAIGVTR